MHDELAALMAKVETDGYDLDGRFVVLARDPKSDSIYAVGPLQGAPAALERAQVEREALVRGSLPEVEVLVVPVIEEE